LCEGNENEEMEVKWGRRRWRNGGGGKVVVFGGLGFRCVGDEGKMEKMGERAVRHTEKLRGRRKESDLKRGHVRVLDMNSTNNGDETR
jgi:N-acetylglucosamine kinase-like BadF-type ATPase